MNLEKEKELVQKALNDPNAFGYLYDIYFPIIYNYVRWRVDKTEDAQDIVSIIFEKVLVRLNTFQFRENISVKSWIFRITHNTLVDYYRSGYQKSVQLDDKIELPSQEKPISQIAEENALLRQVKEILIELSDCYRDVIQMRFFAEMTNKEIAFSLNISEKTVSSYISRGTKILHKKLMKGA
jgi:RNA polymerase sigma-70 factor (ECF subfamily)